MKKRSIIWRISLYTALVCAVIAVWTAHSVLNIPDTEPTASEVSAFDTTTNQMAQEINDLRRNDLLSMSALDKVLVSDSPDAIPASAVHSNSRGIMLDKNDSIIGSWNGEDGTRQTDRVLEPSDELASALDSADDLYKERINLQVETLEPYLRDSIIDLRSAAVRWFGYHQLYNTIGRDIIRYRALNSLDLMEIKRDLYSDSYNEVHALREAARAETRVGAMELEDAVKSDYDERLAILLDEIAALVIADAITRDLPDSVTALDSIKYTISEFSPPGWSHVSVTHVPSPDIDTSGWINFETDLTTLAENALVDERTE